MTTTAYAIGQSFWGRGEFTGWYKDGSELVHTGWISPCGIWGLHRNKKGNMLVITHVPTGVTMGMFPNHELATYFISVLPDLSSIYRDSENIRIIASDALRAEIINIIDWAVAALGAERHKR